MVLLGYQASPLLLQAPWYIAVKHAELHLQTEESFCPLQFNLRDSNRLALSSYVQFKLLMVKQPSFSSAKSLNSIFYLSYLILETIILSPLSLHFAKQKQLF